MLQLKNIIKDYKMGDTTINVLKGINLTFRKNEFVSIIGPSGCGKTTMLNIIGGLDKYTSGDLIIDDCSTKEYTDQNWDSYRNNTIGFVFQTYNLISHLTVLDNVAIALTLSGVTTQERTERAKKALDEVGLLDQINKKPNQLSGGQMQRVAIARALINNPSILLADEPTGALDSVTSVQIMDILKKISHDRLIIMVTHNGELAEQYSDRIVKLLDGKVVADSAQFESVQNAEVKKEEKIKKTSMSFFTALKLSFKNLLTKKTRTIITSVAGSIGIIGVALVLAISSGMNSYVKGMQSDTLAGFPISISQSTYVDIMNMPQDKMDEMMGTNSGFTDENILIPYDPAVNQKIHTNKIDKTYLDYLNNLDKSLYNSLSLTRLVEINLVYKTPQGGYKVLENNKTGSSMMPGMGSNGKMGWQQLPNNKEFLKSQYDLLRGEEFPSKSGEIALVVDKNNTINVSLLQQLGIPYENDSTFTFEDIIGKQIRVVDNNIFYSNLGNGIFTKNNNYEEMYNNESQQLLTITSIIRVKEDSTSTILSNGIAYTEALTDSVLTDSIDSDIVTALNANNTINVLDGSIINNEQYKTLLKKLGGDTTPTDIQIYPVSFDAKEQIKTYLDQFNSGKEQVDKIIYSDMAEMVTSTISTLINTVSLILTAFAAISLVVSTIMIGIITYVSVVERTKEIGILRSIGARKKDISRVFNAETLIVGFISGIIGVGITYLLSIPINLLIFKLVGISTIANLPIWYGAALIVLSMVLTLIGGLIPSKIASKKDPVVALRTE